MAKLLDISVDEAKPLINRCHRGGDRKYYKEEKRIRPIYIAFMRWDTCEDLLNAARKQSEFSLDYKYGPLTTVRRNEALKYRRELKGSGDIVSGFVKFPAVLMGKKTSEGKYTIIRDFSDDEVNFNREKWVEKHSVISFFKCSWFSQWQNLDKTPSRNFKLKKK